MMKETFLVTGGAGFIGTNFVKMLVSERPEATVVVLDALTYCGNIKSLIDEIDGGRIRFVHGDIGDSVLVDRLLQEYTPTYIVNFAAESHVDRSLQDSRPFVRTNVEGTMNMLDCAKRQMDAQKASGNPVTLRRFIQISTDEVYGQLPLDCPDGREYPSEARKLLQGHEIGVMYGSEAFSETSPLKPSSPYSASKTSADLFALAYYHSFGLPVVVTRCSNNYGPYQHPEKLIPLMINNIRNRCKLPDNSGIDRSLIAYVADRPGHDARYAINAEKAMTELGWRPQMNFSDGLRITVEWYLAHRQWLEDIVNGDYLGYYKKMYSNR